MTPSQAVAARRTFRAFLDRPVDPAILRDVLAKALRAPSNSNLQPWLVHVASGPALARLKAATAARSTIPSRFDDLPYPIYPEPISAAHDARRSGCAELQYGARGIAREDAHGRMAYVYGNHQFFGAPAGLFVFTEPEAGPSQWADLGIFLQTVMLLLTEAGIGSCPQISWARFHRTVGQMLHVPERLVLYCGLAIGYPDPHDPINALSAPRAELEELVTFHEA